MVHFFQTWYFGSHAFRAKKIITTRTYSNSMLIIKVPLLIAFPTYVFPFIFRILLTQNSLMAFRTLLKLRFYKLSTKISISQKILIGRLTVQDSIAAVHTPIVIVMTVTSISNNLLMQIIIFRVIEAMDTRILIFDLFSYHLTVTFCTVHPQLR